MAMDIDIIIRVTDILEITKNLTAGWPRSCHRPPSLCQPSVNLLLRWTFAGRQED